MPDSVDKLLDNDNALDGFSRAQVSMILTNPNLEDNPIVYVNEAFQRMTPTTIEKYQPRVTSPRRRSPTSRSLGPSSSCPRNSACRSSFVISAGSTTNRSARFSSYRRAPCDPESLVAEGSSQI